MTLTPAQRGYRFQRRVVADLKKNGYFILSSAGSLGTIDVCGLKHGEILLVQNKLNGKMLPAERSALLLLARQTGGRPIVAWQVDPKKPRYGIGYRELTGPGPREHKPWTPDTYGDAA